MDYCCFKKQLCDRWTLRIHVFTIYQVKCQLLVNSWINLIEICRTSVKKSSFLWILLNFRLVCKINQYYFGKIKVNLMNWWVNWSNYRCHFCSNTDKYIPWSSMLSSFDIFQRSRFFQSETKNLGYKALKIVKSVISGACICSTTMTPMSGHISKLFIFTLIFSK